MKPLTKPYHAWTYEDAMEQRNELYEGELVANLYRLLIEERARVHALEREAKAAMPDAHAACELLRRQA